MAYKALIDLSEAFDFGSLIKIHTSSTNPETFDLNFSGIKK